MILSRKFTIQTLDSRAELIRKLQQVVDTRFGENERNSYKGEFIKEGFIILKKGNTNYSSDITIFGKFEEGSNGTDIIINIQTVNILKFVFLFFNLILGSKLIYGFINSSEDWPTFLFLVVLLWSFFLLAMWFNVKKFKQILIEALA